MTEDEIEAALNLAKASVAKYEAEMLVLREQLRQTRKRENLKRYDLRVGDRVVTSGYYRLSLEVVFFTNEYCAILTDDKGRACVFDMNDDGVWSCTQYGAYAVLIDDDAKISRGSAQNQVAP